MGNHNPVMTIRHLSQATGVPAPTIRYYEEIGLLPAPHRSASDQRRYDGSDLARLTFIRRCRDFGFSIDRIRVLSGLSTSPLGDCAQARDIAAGHLSEVQARIAEMQAFAATLSGFVAACDAVCCGGAGRDCVMLTALQTPLSQPVGVPDLRR